MAISPSEVVEIVLVSFLSSCPHLLSLWLECISLGSPRIGCNYFAREFAMFCKDSLVTKFGRFVRTDLNNVGRDDLVTTVPPWCKHGVSCQRIKNVNGMVIIENRLDDQWMSFDIETHDCGVYCDLILRSLIYQ